MNRFIKILVVLMMFFFAMPAVAPASPPTSLIGCAISCLLVSPGPGQGLGACFSGCRAAASSISAHRLDAPAAGELRSSRAAISQ